MGEMTVLETCVLLEFRDDDCYFATSYIIEIFLNKFLYN